MKLQKLLIFIPLLFLPTLFLGGFPYMEAKDITVVSRQAAMLAGTLAKPLPTPCNILDKLNEKDDLLEAVQLQVGSEDIEYYEDRILVGDGSLSIVPKKQLDPEKQIALKVLHQDTCEVEIILITKHGDELLAPSGWEIEPVTRSNGIRWNYWNTEYRIAKPSHAIVLKNKYPNVVEKTVTETVKDKKGKKKTVTRMERTIEPVIYAPYSRDVHTAEIVAQGRDYLRELVQAAFRDLRAKKVPSLAYPGTTVADVTAFAPEFFERLPVIEHVDMVEFTLEPRRITERVLVIVGLNKTKDGNVAFSYTGNNAGANGLMQFTDNGKLGTYTMVRQNYPKAKLNPDFAAGVRDHLTSMEAAILLHDLNLQYLIKKYGTTIAADPRLEEYLAALYNASPGSVTKSLSASLLQQAEPAGEWTASLLRETKGYITKLRYLRGTP